MRTSGERNPGVPARGAIWFTLAETGVGREKYLEFVYLNIIHFYKILSWITKNIVMKILVHWIMTIWEFQTIRLFCEDWALTKKCGKTKYVNLSKCEVRGGGCRESLKDKW